MGAPKNFCAATSLNVNTNIFAKRFLVRACKNENVLNRTLIQPVVGEQLTARVRLGEPNTFLATTPGIEYRETFRIRTGAHRDILGSKSHYPAETTLP
ncbi:MAG: hypothetical protein IJT59_07160 [Desulfovibrionaceae bacterium]|nr:hypothetical protein [Desulfovibrionaceae bacterium]